MKSLGAGQGVVRGRGSDGVGEGHSTSGGVDAVMGDVNNIAMMGWYVAGWSKGCVLGAMGSVVKYDFRAKVIRAYNPNIACIVETWLREERKWNLKAITGLVITEVD